jgi:hypothetical protein
MLSCSIAEEIGEGGGREGEGGGGGGGRGGPGGGGGGGGGRRRRRCVTDAPFLWGCIPKLKNCSNKNRNNSSPLS